MPGTEVRIIRSQVIKGVIIWTMVQSGVAMIGDVDRVEAGTKAASNKVLEEMRKDPNGGNHGEVQ